MKSKIRFIAIICLLCSLSFLLSACGQKIELKIEFIVDDAVYATKNTKGNEALVMPPDPVKGGYIFDGWYWDKDLWQRPFTANSLLNEPLTENLKIYANWNDEKSLKGTQAIFVGFTEVSSNKYETTTFAGTTMMDFTEVVVVSNKSTWELTTDIFAQNTIPSKMAVLSSRLNTYYVLVRAENGDVKLYIMNITVPETDPSEPEIELPDDEEVTEPIVFCMPINGDYEIIANYSETELVWDSVTGRWIGNLSVKIAAGKGTHTFATYAGVITTIVNDSLEGTIVEITHINGLVTRYYGLGSNLDVRRGDSVEQGQKIGTVGGRPVDYKDGPHIKLEVLLDYKKVNPANYILELQPKN